MISSNINIQAEKDFRFISDNIDIWPEDGSFPFKQGDKFPTDKLIERANVSYTNRLLYNNEYGDVFNSILSVIPETDMIYAQRIKDIIADLPFFKIVVDAFVSICISKAPLIDTVDTLDQQISELVDRSNFKAALESMIKSLFIDQIDAYRVTSNLEGDPIIEQIPVKNLMVYNHPKYLSSICCTLVSNILKDKVEFIEYWYDGKMVKRVFQYNNGKLGQELSCEESAAFDGKYKKSPIVIVKHNTDTVNDTYGHDQMSTWDGSIVALCRTFSNLLRLNERVREIIKLVPESALTITGAGQAAFINKGVITYADGLDASQRPEIEILIPDIKNNVDACKETMERCIKMISMSTGLSPSWFDPEKTGSNMSAKSLMTAMLPTILKGEMLVGSIEDSVKDIVVRIGNMYDIDIRKTQVDITWFSGIKTDDDIEMSNIVNTRLANGTISKEDAIIKMDRVSRRIAKERAASLAGITDDKNKPVNNKPIGTESLELSADSENSEASNVVVNPNDVKTGSSKLTPDYEMAVIPTDIRG